MNTHTYYNGSYYSCFIPRPFERTVLDNEEIQKGLELIPALTSQVSPHVLKELCVVAQLDVWKDENVTRKIS